ncbi:hypothetical protein OKA04_12375 [Luteolibacter flavescens]|uniref:Terminase large subunit n=1 Tax=Luteolibacter flavescens TaxID=1859460 RepID=A0ABT3FPP1_9BACT|nr:hypothetical protein [Luteolibacter flavescens]MCW1885527.1 hypothetical protein [Luteolibacter flavescens]
MTTEPEIVTRFRTMLDEASEDDLTALAYNSPAVHFALFMEIKDKNGRYIRPEPNVLQLRVSEVIETLRVRCPGTRIRIIGVKPRRAGLSTFSLHCGYHEAQRRTIEGITIADCKENSAMLTERLADYSGHDSFPWDNPLVQDATGTKAWANGSKWTVDTAENPDAGVGGTRQFGHMSEVSKYPQTEKKNDRKTITAAMPSFDGDDTVVIAESTPENAAGWFYDTFNEGMWLDDFLRRYEEGFRPEEVWIKVFAAWHEFADYRRKEPVSEIERGYIDETLTEIEREGRAKYGWTYEQLAWRRDTIDSQCDKDPRIFAFYYPSDPVSCWIAGGTPRFDMERLLQMEERAKIITPDLGFLIRQHDNVVSFSPQHDGSGDIEIYEHPVPGMKYGLVLDPAESLSQTVGADPDANSLGVWRGAYQDEAMDVWRPMKLVARLKAPFRGEEDDVADHAIRLSRYYGTCIAAQEVNKGFHILRRLQLAGIPCYKRKPLNNRTGKVEEQYGFKMTDANTREALVSSLASALVNGDLDIPCEHMIGEMKKFIRNAKGKSVGALGYHDDDVIHAAIAWEVIPSSATEYRVVKIKNVEPKDRGPHGWKARSWG